MTYHNKLYITLDSMGVPFDSRMQYDYPGIDFTPFVGCKVYNPQGHTIGVTRVAAPRMWCIRPAMPTMPICSTATSLTMASSRSTPARPVSGPPRPGRACCILKAAPTSPTG